MSAPYWTRQPCSSAAAIPRRDAWERHHLRRRGNSDRASPPGCGTSGSPSMPPRDVALYHEVEALERVELEADAEAGSAPTRRRARSSSCGRVFRTLRTNSATPCSAQRVGDRGRRTPPPIMATRAPTRYPGRARARRRGTPSRQSCRRPGGRRRASPRSPRSRAAEPRHKLVHVPRRFLLVRNRHETATESSRFGASRRRTRRPRLGRRSNATSTASWPYSAKSRLTMLGAIHLY